MTTLPGPEETATQHPQQNPSGTSRHCLQLDSASTSLFQSGSSPFCPQRRPDGDWKLRGSENALCWTPARWMDAISGQEPERCGCWTRLRISTAESKRERRGDPRTHTLQTWYLFETLIRSPKEKGGTKRGKKQSHTVNDGHCALRDTQSRSAAIKHPISPRPFISGLHLITDLTL